MVNRATKLRWRRRVRRKRQQVENFGEQAEQHIEEHIIGRLGRLWRVRRFLLGWIVLIVFLIATMVVQTRALSQYYQTPQPAEGGTYNEGILGTFTTANPLYATGPVDSSVAKLLFSGLFKYDADTNKLVGDLADKYTANDRGNVYTVTLKPNLKWQDGQPLTSKDVVFTYATIQNSDADSPLLNSWAGVKVASVNDRTVTFTLPSALAAFPYSMTNGIVPEHILKGIPPSQLRSISFNTNRPIGSGPFKWKAIEVVGNDESREERVALSASTNYHGATPRLSGFTIRAFHNEQAIIKSFNKKELDGIVGFNAVPADIAKHQDYRQYSFPLTSATMVFFKTSSGLLADPTIRKAIAMGTNSQNIAANLGYPVQTVDEPFLRGQPGYDPTLKQMAFNVKAANDLLQANGWVMGADGVRQKGNQRLSFSLVSENTPEYTAVTKRLREQWRAIGVDPQISLQPSSDLQTTLAFHTYDALLYGISIGVDPDVMAYWHSSQADIRSANRLNFSEYKNTTADTALEAGRSRTDPAIRTAKYKPFVEAWRNDVPAIGLYQPRFLYITRQTVGGLKEHTINEPIDRLDSVTSWSVRETLQDTP